jgi:lipopolysaccharide biosynthesis glycosyltransferase
MENLKYGQYNIMIKIPYYPDNIPIVFSSNDYFVPNMSANMQSIMENAKKDKKYCFFVLHKDLSKEYMNLLEEQISVYVNFSISFISVSEYFDGVNFFMSRGLTVEAYFRLLIPYIFSEYDKILYLDGDMICLTDISVLFDINLDNIMLAAIGDTNINGHYCAKNSEYLKLHTVLPNLKYPLKYFNSGLILFNTAVFRNSISWNEIVEISLSQNFYCHDQDILNLITDGQILTLPYHWNFMYTDKAKYLSENLFNEYVEAKKSPKIIHFIWKKPWERDYYVPYFEYFWKYATRTPFIDVIVKSMYDKNIIYENFREKVLSNIHQRRIGLKFILLDCIKAWLFRKKK